MQAIYIKNLTGWRLLLKSSKSELKLFFNSCLFEGLINSIEMNEIPRNAISNRTKDPEQFHLLLCLCLCCLSYICYLPVGRSILGKTVSEVLCMARNRRLRAIRAQDRGYSFYQYEPRVANNIFSYGKLVFTTSKRPWYKWNCLRNLHQLKSPHVCCRCHILCKV